MRIIGLSGPAGSGKDSAADIFVSEGGFEKISFASAVKDSVYALSPYIFYDGYWQRISDVVDYEGWDKVKRSSKEARRLLQRLGAEVGREIIGENTWIEVVRSKIENSATQNIVIPDLRYKNEADFIKSFGKGKSLTIRIERGNAEEIAATHSSEKFDFTCDTTWKNNGTLEEWQNVVIDSLKFRGSDLNRYFYV